MKLVNFLFPIKLYLTILQLEGYDPLRFLNWITKNFRIRKLPEKKSLTFTFKLKLIVLVSVVVVFASFFYLSVFVAFLFLLQPYLPLALSVTILVPFERLYKIYLIGKNRALIKSFKNLKVIGITGSYGKSSVKEILYHLLKDKHKTLRSPESFNTILGLNKFLSYELDKSYQVLICEMAAYKKGDIRELCRMVPPQFGILTGIASQHLERFGSIKNVVLTKLELYEAVGDLSNFIFNLDSSDLRRETERRKFRGAKNYLDYRNVVFSKKGSSFEMIYMGKRYVIKTGLFGYSNIKNLVGAISAALLLRLPLKYLIERAKSISQFEHRFEIKNYENSVIVDNTFSSNEISFKEMINTAKELSGKKVLVTPGLVELGEEEKNIHEKLGHLAGTVFDEVVLVGRNTRTLAFSSALGSKSRFIPDSRSDYFKAIESLKDKYDWIFLENDITQNY